MGGTQSGTIANGKVGRNDPCPCGSGKRFKHCCEGRSAEKSGRLAELETLSPFGPGLPQLRREAADHLGAARWVAALQALQRIVEQKPDDFQAHFQLGVARLRLGEWDEAVSNLQQAVSLKPSFTAALAQLASALENASRSSEAAAVHRKLCRLAKDPTQRTLHEATALALEGKREEAVDRLRRALVHAPKDPGARLKLGDLLTDLGRFDEAAGAFTQAVDLTPIAFARLTAVRRMTEDDLPLIERIRSAVESRPLPAEPRIAVHFGLAKAYDDLGDAAEAMRQYDVANGLAAATIRLDRAALASWRESVIGALDTKTLQRADPARTKTAAADDETPVLIVGMPRSGTTLVEQIVSAHPAVAAGGELPIWGM